MTKNNAEIQSLKETLNNEYIAKANAFAYMIKLDPDIKDNISEMNRICKMLDVDELHITDNKGVLRWGTVEGYYGFDFATSDQAKEFMPILDDISLEIAQEPQVNGAEGKLFQYVSVARRDSKGIVQVGLKPTRLDNAIQANSLDNVLTNYTFGDDAFVFAVNKADHTFLSYKNNPALLGKSAIDAGIKERNLKNEYCGTIKIDGISYYAMFFEQNDMFLCTAVPVKNMQEGCGSIIAVIILLVLIIFVAIYFVLKSIIKKLVINGLNNTVNVINQISSGNLNAVANEHSAPEFSVLSDGINNMTNNLKAKISEAHDMVEKQNNLFKEISLASVGIRNQSDSMQGISHTLSTGSSTQAATVEEISAAFSNITESANQNSKQAGEAAKIAEKTEAQLNVGVEKLKLMNKSMEEISGTSTQIKTIIKTIDDIAFQTNILALNAAVEAARAGVHGKGFAVVADEVRTLANKSAEAASNTSVLIQTTLDAIDKGNKVANETADTLMSLLDITHESTTIMNDIYKHAESQAKAIGEVNAGVEQISTVIQDNSRISADAESTANKLTEESNALNNLIAIN